MEDVSFAVHLTDTMGWNHIDEDFVFMMRLESDGCFVLLDDSDKIGIVTNITFGQVGWLGNLIVSEDHRRKGAGSQLLRHSIEYHTNKNAETIGLYSYIKTTPFYERQGFKYNSEFVVLRGEGFSELTNASLREAGKEDIEEIIEFDTRCFGASRRKLLKAIMSDSDNFCYLAIENRRMCGYVMAKIYESFAEVGPLICHKGRVDIAVNLLKEILKKLEGLEVSMCIPKKETAVIKMLMTVGFHESFRVVRMFYDHPVINDHIYIAESLERG